jgi:hypothetical protein
MNKLILATGSNLNYLHKMTGYLKSIEANSNFDSNYLVFLGDDEMKMKYEKIKIVNVYQKDLEIVPSNYCIQHGEFLKSKMLDELTSDDDVIFFTDGDIKIQRALTEEEVTRFKNFKDDDIYVGYNASPTDTLHDESLRLGIIDRESSLLKKDLKKIKVYNTGVLAMNKKTWIKLMNQFIEHYPEVDKTFHHYAKQQWLLSLLINTNGYNVYEMPYDIHNHLHYPSPVGTQQDADGTVYYNNKKVLFKHKWD